MLTLEELQNGQVLLIDKPLQWSSFQAVNKIKWAIIRNYKIKKIKIGHAGTLDPLASGLLVVCTGKFTKKITEFQAETKTYTGIIRLGATTPSYDLETEVDTEFPTEHITESDLERVRQLFLGEIKQYPPVFSAIKKEGKRLYELARTGEAVERINPRMVTIEKFVINTSNFPDIDFEIVCSKGTYIRSLAHDFGQALHSGAHLIELRRTKSGDFSVDKALTPDDFINTFIPKKPLNERILD